MISSRDLVDAAVNSPHFRVKHMRVNRCGRFTRLFLSISIQVCSLRFPTARPFSAASRACVRSKSRNRLISTITNFPCSTSVKREGPLRVGKTKCRCVRELGTFDGNEFHQHHCNSTIDEVKITLYHLSSQS